MENILMLKKILTNENIVSSISENESFLFYIMPELKTMLGFEHKHPHHFLDVYEHTKLALSYSINNFDVRLALLLHDIGKPIACTEGSDGVRHFKGHAKISSEISERILTRIGFNENYVKKICYLIENHDEAIQVDEIKNNLALQKIRLEIQRCDSLAHSPNFREKRLNYINTIRQIINKIDFEVSAKN